MVAVMMLPAVRWVGCGDGEGDDGVRDGDGDGDGGDGDGGGGGDDDGDGCGGDGDGGDGDGDTSFAPRQCPFGEPRLRAAGFHAAWISETRMKQIEVRIVRFRRKRNHEIDTENGHKKRTNFLARNT